MYPELLLNFGVKKWRNKTPVPLPLIKVKDDCPIYKFTPAKSREDNKERLKLFINFKNSPNFQIPK